MSLSSDGTVTDVEFRADVDSLSGVEFYSGILVPGFVNAHCHLELSCMKGIIPEACGFVPFAKHIGARRSDFSDGERRMAMAAADAKMYSEGVSAVGDICNGTTSFSVKKSSGIHYHSFLESYGLQTKGTEHIEPVAQAARISDLPHSITPHATYSLNEAAFDAAVGDIDGGTGKGPLSIHFMESPSEAELFRDEGEMAVWNAGRGLAADFSKWDSPAARIVSQVPADRKILLIHNCFVTERDVDMITGHFGHNVTWVLCPRSNDYILRVLPPYEMLRSKGVRIAVGTDSLASNRSLNMIEELKMFRGVPLEELLAWACSNGAEALGLDGRFGELETGKRCGVVLLSGVDWETMSLTPESVSVRLA